MTEDEILAGCERVIYAQEAHLEQVLLRARKIKDDGIREAGVSLAETDLEYLRQLRREVNWWRRTGTLLSKEDA